MQVGDLVKLLYVTGGDLGALRGTVLDIYTDPEGECESLLVSVLWTDGDRTQEFLSCLEAVCK